MYAMQTKVSNKNLTTGAKGLEVNAEVTSIYIKLRSNSLSVFLSRDQVAVDSALIVSDQSAARYVHAGQWVCHLEKNNK